MVILDKQKDFQAVRNLPFCYLCEQNFLKDDITDSDHVPPKNAFHSRDKEPPLKLKTHKTCNGSFSADDKKFGQLIALKRFVTPKSPRDYALSIVNYPHLNMASVENFNIPAAAWRCISGFHAALYRQPLPQSHARAIELPFPRAHRDITGNMKFYPLRQQHLVFVENIKRNRAHGSIDKIVSNNRKSVYECVWCRFDNDDRWLCMFAWDMYNWKDLGSHSMGQPARGCAGCYVLPDGSVPENAARDHARGVIIPNYDPFDPFSP